MTVNAAIQAVADTVHAHTSLAGIAYDVGQLSLEVHQDRPIVNWVSQGGAIEVSEDAGVEVLVDGVTQYKLVDVADLEIHIWASEDETALSARTIMHRILSVAVNAYETAIRFDSYAVETEEPEHADLSVRGQKAVLTGTVRFPICDVDADGATTVTVESHTHDGIHVDAYTGTEESAC